MTNPNKPEVPFDPVAVAIMNGADVADEVQSTANSSSTAQKSVDSVPSIAPGLLHGVGGRFVATGGGGLIPASDQD